MERGTRDPNNPARVPRILAVLDQPQEGLPRVIHPIGLAVGRPDPLAATQGVRNTMDAFAGDVLIEEDATYVNDAGDPYSFKAGDRISAARAAAFPELAKKIDQDKPIVGTNDARAVYEAPENRMETGAPQNRGSQMVRSGGQYNDMTANDLRALATERGVEVPSDAKKADIVAALQGAEGTNE